MKVFNNDDNSNILRPIAIMVVHHINDFENRHDKYNDLLNETNRVSEVCSKKFNLKLNIYV